MIMKKYTLLAILVTALSIICCHAVHAQYGSTRELSRYHAAYLTETITIGSTTATGFTAGNIYNTSGTVTTRVFFTVQDNAVKVLWDGTSPGTQTTDAGHAVAKDTAFQVVGYNNIANFLAISTGTQSVFKVTYEKKGVIREQTP
jgi:hypothetical protein